MSSAFNPFPANVSTTSRKTVDYGTGVIVSEDGAIVTDRLITDSCLAITIPPLGHAERVAEDKEHDLALLRIYGVRGLKPLDLASGQAGKTSVEVTGIADPQNQGGGRAASVVKAAVSMVGSAGDLALTPAPALGFSGAAARDESGQFAGVAVLKPVATAGPVTTTAAQSMLVPADAVREFLKANGVNAAGRSTDAVASVVRVICVRK